MLLPLLGFVAGDTIGLLVLAREDMTIEHVADKLRQSARVRVDIAGPWELRVGDRVATPSQTVAEAGLRPLQRVDLRRVQR
jgi:hypothetical protein